MANESQPRKEESPRPNQGERIEPSPDDLDKDWDPPGEQQEPSPDDIEQFDEIERRKQEKKPESP